MVKINWTPIIIIGALGIAGYWLYTKLSGAVNAIAEPISNAIAPVTSEIIPELTLPKTGETIGGYSIIDLIGKGAGPAGAFEYVNLATKAFNEFFSSNKTVDTYIPKEGQDPFLIVEIAKQMEEAQKVMQLHETNIATNAAAVAKANAVIGGSANTASVDIPSVKSVTSTITNSAKAGVLNPTAVVTAVKTTNPALAKLLNWS